MRLREIVTNLLCLGLLLGLAGFGGLDAASADDKSRGIGEQVPNTHSLRDVRGNSRALHDFKGTKAIVVAFVGTQCPVTNLYLPELIALEKKYREQGVQFLGVYPNHADDVDRIAGHAYDRDTPFLVVKDIGQKLADALGVTRVPTVVVLDGNHVLRYRGRVDDRYSVAAQRPQATRDDLAQALEEVLAGKKVSVPETEADGCLIGRDPKTAVSPGITYSKHVAPILQARCQVCHRPEQSAPFSLLTYEDAVNHGRMIKEVTLQRRMPPWHADARYGHFAGERRLAGAEIDAIAAWVDGGMPRGDARDLPRPLTWAKGWTHGKPDLVLEMPEAFEVPATGAVPYKNWIIDPKFTEDKWVQAAECRPGAMAVVHHVVVYIMKEGQRGPVSSDGMISMLVGWAPGDLGLLLPPDTALRVPKGARLRLEMHYTPNGTAQTDRSAVGITFAKAPPKYELCQSEFANTSIAVAANDPHYKAEATFRVPADARLISLAPHMHYRGKHYFYEAIFPDGKKETLLSVPRWDFNWQNVYRFQEPVKVPKGTKLHSVAHWDNSTSNLLNPAPGVTAKFGLQSWEEMMVGFVSYVWERPETAAELAKNPPKQSDLVFDRLDVNGDGVITADELSAQMKAFAPLVGYKIPEKITRSEFEKLFNEMRQRIPQRKAKTALNFVFGPGKVEPGYIRVTPDTIYTKERGHGFDFGSKVEGIERGGTDVPRAGFITSSAPFYFSVDVPEGNYDVTVTLGDAQGESTTTVLAETRRPAVIGLHTGKGNFEARTFTTNVHNSFLSNGKQIGLTDRERKGGPNGGMFLHLDGDKLTLEFADKRPCVCAVEIVKNDSAPTLFLCGDSTVTDQPRGEFCSWGQTLPLFFKPKLAAVANHAESGRTSGGFIGERRLDKIAELIKRGDYLFVHFAHNDSHAPGNVSIPAYKKNIEKFIEVARAKGATPILITTMNRLGFDADGKAKADLDAYAEAMREVARDKKEFLIDLNKMSIEFYEALGPEMGKMAFKTGDKTHSAFYGAYEFSRFIAESIKNSALPLGKLVIEDLPARNYGGPVMKVAGF